MQLIAKSLLKQRSLNQIRHCLIGCIQIWHHLYFKKKLKYFSDFKNQNYSVLWLKWTQTIKSEQNQTFFHGEYSSMTSYIFLSKNIKVSQWLWKSKFFSFMTEWNPNNRNEVKSDIFSWDIFKSGNMFHWSQNTKIFPWLS